MKYKTGIWIDTRKAMIIHINGEDNVVETLNSEVEERVRVDGEGKTFGRFGNQFVNEETKKEHRHDQQVKDFLEDVTSKVDSKQTEAIVIFGPAEMKTKLHNVLENNHQLKGLLRKPESADSMTDNQTVAWVEKYYGFR